MTALWTSAEAAAATGGRTTTDWQASGVSIDTRALAPGDLFVALKDVRDGHDFVAQALDKGAAAALVSRIPDGVAADAPLLIVNDVLPGLNKLAATARARTRARVIAITGSMGKTSTKEMLRTVLGRQGRVHASEASYNNHWGVPLTLARMPVDTDFAVIEIGMNHPGEIAPLSRLTRPHVAMITNVAEVHMEAFDDGLEGIAREKIAIEAGLDPEDELSARVVCADLDEVAYKVVFSEMSQQGARRFWYGTDDGNPWHLTKVTLAGDCTIVNAMTPDGPVLFKLSVPGQHFAINALGVLAAVKALDADPVVAALDLIHWHPPAGRGTRERLSLDAVDPGLTLDLIDDAFNANPTSVAAALDVLAASAPRHGVGRIRRGRRIAILGDMLELGPAEKALHSGLADLPSLGVADVVHTVGPLMRHLHDSLPENQRGQWVEVAADLARRAHTLIDAGDVILVKGSKGSKVSLVVDAIRKLGNPLATETEDVS